MPVYSERLGISAWIVDHDFEVQVRIIGPPVTLDGVQFFGVRVPREIEPELIVEADGIDDQGIAFPFAGGVSVPGGVGVVGMSAAVHENLPVAVDVSFVIETRSA